MVKCCPMWTLAVNSGPLQEQQVHLTAELFLQASQRVSSQT